MADATPPSVTRDDLREALAPRAGRRPSRLLGSVPEESPAWEWDADLATGDRLELEELRQVVGEQREHLERAEAAREAAAAREEELRAALAELAGAGILARRGVVAELRARGLV
jgi:hypothetical protein